MSSSSDIEKLFDHFGGDANAYQEIGRENEARSARTRWPLLVTLDLTQPTIPAIGQRREAKPQSHAVEAPVAVDRQDTTPKDAASVTRAKAPLFTRSHRRDIPPVAVAAPATVPKGASRFGELEAKDAAMSQAGASAVRGEAAAPVVAQAAPIAAPAQFAPADAPAAVPTRSAPLAPANQSAQAASVPPAIPLRPPVTQTFSSAAPSWAPAPAPAYTTAPPSPAVPAQPASILGKLFAPEPASAPTPPQAAATRGESAPLQAVFDRLRGTPAQAAAAPAGATRAATPATSNSWLINGPRRS
jgi:hypothetical protein